MADTQKPPKVENDWDVICASRWAVAIDNVSTISDWWSDALCRAVTGAGWARRALYTDDDEAVTAYRRVISLNGITLGGHLRGDLAERLVMFALHRPARYLTEREVDAELDAMRPRLLGALLDQLVATLRALDHVEVVRDLRMADWATFLAAYDHAHGTDALGTYRREVDELFAEALDADPVATAVVAFMADRDEWTGTATDLLDRLRPHRPADDDRWPARPHHLSSWIERSATALRRESIGFERLPRTRRGRLLQLVKRDGRDAGDANPPFVTSGGSRGGERPEPEREEKSGGGSRASRASRPSRPPTDDAEGVGADACPF